MPYGFLWNKKKAVFKKQSTADHHPSSKKVRHMPYFLKRVCEMTHNHKLTTRAIS
jgi:hypothetical protein